MARFQIATISKPEQPQRGFLIAGMRATPEVAEVSHAFLPTIEAGRKGWKPSRGFASLPPDFETAAGTLSSLRGRSHP